MRSIHNQITVTPLPLAVSLLFGLVTYPAGPAWADFTGVVTAVLDGDTVIVRTSGRKVRVRLDQIDAPEFDQDWGRRSRAALSDLVLRRTVRVKTSGSDDYGRTLGHLYVAPGRGSTVTDVDAELVRTGNAWAYRQYLRDESLLELENEARRERRGLWSQPGAIPPWQHRHANRSTRPRVRVPEPVAGCGSKRYCRQMDDCAEAYRYLKCGLTRLDGDNDGVPCEVLCRSFNQ